MYYKITAPGWPDAYGDYRDEMEARAMIRNTGLVKDMKTVKVTAIWPPTTAFEPISVKPWMGGYCWLYKFDNGYGASVVLHSGSYGHEDGQYELLLAKFDGDEISWRRPDVAFVENMEASEPGGDSSGLYGWLDSIDVTRILGAIRGYTPPWLMHQI
jgi:hypothetical protein